MNSWDGPPEPPHRPIGAGGFWRIFRRGGPMFLVVFGGLAVLLVVRLAERPLHGVHRPWTPYITQTVCRCALYILGLPVRVSGRVMCEDGACVANHGSWLDIFVLNASKRIYFVAKSEVAGWPGIGWLARATGTLFIRRDRREAAAQTVQFQTRLEAGHKLVFFPEGTSTDARRVLRFKTALFEAFFAPPLRDQMHIQPVCVIYHAPQDASPDFYGWWGSMDFAGHLLEMLAAPRHGSVDVVYFPALAVKAYTDRKSLARAAEAIVRQGLQEGLGPDAYAGETE